MKLLFFAIAFISSFSAFAQSFILQDSGKLMTIDKQGFIYDLGHNVVPDEVRMMGKNWFINKEGLNTVAADGLLYKKSDFVLPRSVKAHGGEWMIGNKSELVVVASSGMVFTYTEPAVNKAKILSAGSNWLVVRSKDKTVRIITIDAVNGRYFIASSDYMQKGPLKLNIFNVRISGGNWFTDSNGTLYVVRADGGIMSKKELGIFLGVNSKGGNFFVDVRGGVQVILENGFVAYPYLPMVFGNMIKSGSNYAWNTNGDFFIFSEKGPSTNNAVDGKDEMDTLLRSIIKQPLTQIDIRSVVLKD